MASFPLFSRFPVEIQLVIWEFAAALDPEPEVCVAWPLLIEQYTRPPEEPALPFLVDTAWPAVVHVCRVAREAALKSGAVQLRYSPVAGFAVPYRHFIPAIDTLYWGKFQTGAMRLFLYRPENASLARDLRHLSIDLSGWSPAFEVAKLIRRKLVDLRTLSMVFPATANVPETLLPFLPPARRCRLRTMSDKALDEITMARAPLLRAEESGPLPLSLRTYIDKQRENFGRHVREFSVQGPEGTAWSTRDDSFSGLEITAQTFVEYRRTGDQEQWVETCQDRLVPRPGQGTTAPRPRYIWPEDRKRPEEYRVLDDDNSQCSLEENRAYIQRWQGQAPHSWR